MPAQYTYDEYVAFEDFSNVKHEFLDGQIYGRAENSPEHAALGAAFIGQLYGYLIDSWRAYDSNLRVHTPSGLSTYPDVTLTFGAPELDAIDRVAVTNPAILVEVLSRSTEKWDAGEKFEHYKTLASLRQYVLVSHRERSIDVWTRERDDTWQKITAREGEIAELVLGLRLDVRELYDAAAVLPART